MTHYIPTCTLTNANLLEFFKCSKASLFASGSQVNVPIELAVQALDDGEANSLVGAGDNSNFGHFLGNLKIPTGLKSDFVDRPNLRFLNLNSYFRRVLEAFEPCWELKSNGRVIEVNLSSNLAFHQESKPNLLILDAH